MSEEPQHEAPQRPKQKTTQARKTTQAEDNSSTEDPRNPDSRHNRHKHGGTAPVTWRCTRYVAVHPNRRGALPTDRVQRPNKQEQTRNWHTEPLTATPLHAHLGPTGGGMGTPPTPPPALRPTPTPPTPLNAKSRLFSYPERRNLSRLTVLLRFVDAFRPHGHGMCLRCSATVSSPNVTHTGMGHARST